jgi:sigma-B regulation protein RsbU (phosphoserine phosphatase)
MRTAASLALSPSALLKSLNDSLQDRKLDSQYVVMLYAVWHDDNRTLQVANAGATQPLICRNGEVETIKAEGFPLGLFPSVEYEEFTLSTQPGDSLLFFSDGITGAQNEAGEMFGDDRLKAVVQKNHQKPASKIADAILAEVGKFQHGKEHFDDETIVVLKVL